MKSNIGYIKSQIEIFKLKYPNFDILIFKDKFILCGLLEIDKFGDYEIEIDIPINYPKMHPVVREVGGDILKINNRHINEDGTCCIAIKYKISIYLKEDASIVNFVGKYIEPFFANQLYFENTNKWINGEYSHGIQGIIEYIEEELFIDKKILHQLIPLAKKSLINWNKNCPCGSMKIIKKCHKPDIIKIKKIINSA